MTYKNISKIQLYILILLAYFILTNNFQLIFKTRSIIKQDKNSLQKLVFIEKTTKTKVSTKLNLVLIPFDSSKTLLTNTSSQYIRAKQTESSSKLAVLIDKALFMGKRLVDEAFSLSEKLLVSVKYRYLASQKQLAKQRDLYLKRLEELIGARGVPLASGILFGDLSSVSQELYHSFKVIGILHILSASSSNFTLFLNFALVLCQPLRRYLSKKATFGLYFAIIFLYFSLVGSSAATFRAFLTLSLAFYASFILQRACSPLSNLCFAAILMLIINPFYISSLSFQLSFLASFGILFLYSFAKKELFTKQNYIIDSLLLTLSAQFFLLIIFVWQFDELNYLAILANLLVLPLVEMLTILFLASFICLFLSKIIVLHVVEWFLSFYISKIIDILYILINFLEKIPYKSVIINGNKSLYINYIILLNLTVFIFIKRFRSKKYSKNKYRILK